ncbi:Glycosyl transferases group 1 [Pseudomonas peli]|jgi:glycosyltransferase involved in cell wall biosynthesis|uniref:Glycosyl transferases group 1 n=1 Tax=Pseudomonas peli TaxID=592361 RepID=A0AB37Z2N5_9PSED|nr:glycosyltransferase [Pseudomonas peli]NMZ69244.1 glycosyltransferase family 4 protein [Pseudomonas peli]SCW33174.1 Glycosyl transferases group 1 [Pseudomonas peli]
MSHLNDICVITDNTVFSVHHGVRRYLMTLCATLEAQGNRVYLINCTGQDQTEAVVLERSLLVDNGFIGNRLVGSSRSEILDFVRSSRVRELRDSTERVGVRSESLDKLPLRFDLCIVGAPWIAASISSMPMADRYVCVAYDAIPNRYYFDNPEDIGLHLFAHAHYKGYRWADEKADGIFCISELTARECQKFGFGGHSGLGVFPTMIPPGYLTLDASRIEVDRGRVALLAAPFDRRKGLLSIPSLVNAGQFDSLRIFGRPRCSHDELVSFFEKLDIEDIQWWCDVDFDKQVELYTSAKVLIFPSLNEGLGFPVLEAYACGTSVLTSNIEPLNQLVRGEDLLADDEVARFEQVRRRVDEVVDPMNYRRFVEKLCAAPDFGLAGKEGRGVFNG